MVVVAVVSIDVIGSVDIFRFPKKARNVLQNETNWLSSDLARVITKLDSWIKPACAG